MSRLFFKGMVQAMLFFGLGTRVVAPRMVKALGGFQDQVERRLTGRLLQKKLDGKWTYTLSIPEHGRTLHCYVITVRPV